MKLKHLLLPLAGVVCTMQTEAAPVKVTMNTVSTTMSLTAKDSGTAVETGDATNRIYNFETPAGEYILTAYATNGETVNGTIEITIPETDDAQDIRVITNTVYVTNKHTDNTVWTVANGDYTLDVTVNTREGLHQTVTVGNSVTAGRKTFLALNGNSYNVSFIPSEEHVAEGFTTLYKSGTLTGNVNVYGAIPKGEDYSVSLPADAELVLGIKFTHFTTFTTVEPKSVTIEGDKKTHTYYLAQGQVYNFRTWKEGGLTQAGYFTMSADASRRTQLDFNDSDYSAYNPKQINHSVESNAGFETGDIFVNINERGHLSMTIGEKYDAHAMRTWQLTDNSTNNYFMEPDFHYTIVDPEGKPSKGVIEISNADTHESPWSEIKAIGNGTAIVLVTYDAISVKMNGSAYLGGEYWGAIWPENTGVYVVTVGDDAKGINPNMTINAKYNTGTLKVAGKNVDAEHDVFYYLDTEAGASYTFTPEGVDNVSIAYPTIGSQTVSFNGFGTEGVTKNEDGSYTLLLKEGRQIVKLSDASGKSVYQVLTAKSCHREIVNLSREGSKTFQPGDKVKIQYSGLRHPANKLAGIYNMSAYVTYNGNPNGSSLILGSGQYTFGSAASAQAVTIEIPEDFDTTTKPAFILDEGVIQVNGYGDPIGNHRVISPTAGRSPNFTAVAHKTYFGAIPDVSIPVSAFKTFEIKIENNVDDAEMIVIFKPENKELEPNDKGLYEGTYGTYSVVAIKSGYRCYRHEFTIDDNAEGVQTFVVEMEQSDVCWDGESLTEPNQENGEYLIATGSELAWFAQHVNDGNKADARLVKDIDLGNFAWTPIGISVWPPSAGDTHEFTGSFKGEGHKIEGLYINKPDATYQGLFGAVNNSSISGISVYGEVSSKDFAGGLIALMGENVTVDRCASYVDLTCLGSNSGGIAGRCDGKSSAITNSYNCGTITGTNNCGGILGANFDNIAIRNVFNTGEIRATKAGACIGTNTAANSNTENAFSIYEYAVTDGQTLVTEEQMCSGEVAYLLGEAFGQEIGVEEHPVLGGMKVYYDEATNSYSNKGVTSGIEDITADHCGDTVYYNLEGVASDRPFKGFNIVRHPDGTTDKLYMR